MDESTCDGMGPGVFLCCSFFAFTMHTDDGGEAVDEKVVHYDLCAARSPTQTDAEGQ